MEPRGRVQNTCATGGNIPAAAPPQHGQPIILSSLFGESRGLTASASLLAEVRPFDIFSAPPPWRTVLEREVGKLKHRVDVVAIGVTGSVAQGDIWPGSDLDIEVVLKGDKPKEIVTTEQEISVDYGYFGEASMEEIPLDTRPIYDPQRVLAQHLGSRLRKDEIQSEIDGSILRVENYLRYAGEAISRDPNWALVWITLATWPLADAFTLSAGENRTHRRIISRLEKAASKVGRKNFLNDYGKLIGFPRTLDKAESLLRELEAGYHEVWGYFKGKPTGPVYMQTQRDSVAWFKNRIVTLYDYDKRDLVCLVYIEFPFVLSFLFRLAGYEKMSNASFAETVEWKGPGGLWVRRYKRILGLLPERNISDLLKTGTNLLGEVRELAEERLWAVKD
jgi:hypothetical protein